MCKLPVLSCQSPAGTVNWSLVPTLLLHQIERQPLSVVSPSKDVRVAERQRTLLNNVRRRQQQRWSAGTCTTNQLHGTRGAVSSNWWCHCPRTTTTVRLRDDNSKHPTNKLSGRRCQLRCFAVVVVVVVVDPRGILLILSHDSSCCDGRSLPSMGLGTFHDKPSMSVWM